MPGADSHEAENFDPQIFCERAIGYTFADRALLRRCLTHASMARTRVESNERLEFLGDAILGAVVCELLYQQFSEEPEGELTRIKSVVVSRTTCAAISAELKLEHCLIIGKGLMVDSMVPPSLLAAVFESLVAGIFLDGGAEAAREFITRMVQPVIDRTATAGHGRNFKSLLQQHAQRHLRATPTYRLLDQRGPDHSKFFKMVAAIGKTCYLPAWGPNKKEAEQRAAENAWHQLHGLEVPYPDHELESKADTITELDWAADADEPVIQLRLVPKGPLDEPTLPYPVPQADALPTLPPIADPTPGDPTP